MDEYLAFASHGRNDWWRYILAMTAGILLALLGLAILFAVLMVLHLFPPDMAAELTQPKSPVPYFLWTGILFGTFPVSLIVMARLFQNKSPGDVTGRWRWGLFFRGMAIWAAAQFLLVLVDLAIAPAAFSISASHATIPLAASALAGLAAQTFAEEFFFRGYLTQGLLLLLRNPWTTAIVSGLLFGSVHIPNGMPQAVNATLFGIVCALIAIRTGGISFTWGLHLANNYFGAVIVVSGDDIFKGSPGIVSQNTPQLMWWDVFTAALALAGMLWLVLRGKVFLGKPAD